jgi:N-acetyl-ornithine/N-acetyl-lysine deacetylase
MTERVQTPAATLRAWTPGSEEALLTGMLERYSPSREERPLAEWLSGQMRLWGLHAEVDAAGNLIAELPATACETSAAAAPVVLLGHMDTVPGYIPVRREDDDLYGRGAVDAKGPLAAFLSAAAQLAASGAPRARPLIVVGAVEEESATSRGARAILERWRPACVVIGEPSGAEGITVAYKGRLLVRLRLTSPVAHTARPEEGVCARAVAVWTSIQTQAAGWNEAHAASSTFAALQLSLRGIHSGGDGFSDWGELEIGYRLPPGFDTPALISWLEAVAGTEDATIAIRGVEAAYEGQRRGPLVSAFVRAMRAEGIEPSFKRKTGTSDMNVVGPVWRCPIVAYGPGDASLDHTPAERISLSEYARGIAVLERALGDLLE